MSLPIYSRHCIGFGEKCEQLSLCLSLEQASNCRLLIILVCHSMTIKLTYLSIHLLVVHCLVHSFSIATIPYIIKLINRYTNWIANKRYKNCSKIKCCLFCALKKPLVVISDSTNWNAHFTFIRQSWIIRFKEERKNRSFKLSKKRLFSINWFIFSLVLILNILPHNGKHPKQYYRHYHSNRT